MELKWAIPWLFPLWLLLRATEPAAGAFLHCCYRPKAVINLSEILQEGFCKLQYLLVQFTYTVCHIQVFLDVFISLQASRS